MGKETLLLQEIIKNECAKFERFWQSMRFETSTTWTSQDCSIACAQVDRTWHLVRVLERPEGLMFIYKSLELLLYLASTVTVHIRFLFSTLAIRVCRGVSVIRTLVV